MTRGVARPGPPVAVYTDVEPELDLTPGVRRLREAGFEVRVVASSDADRVAAEAADATVLLVGYSRVDGALLDRLPSLRGVATRSVGTDTIDLEAARIRGIWVANVPDAGTEEVATHALSMALALVRGLPFLDRAVRDGHWDGSTTRLSRSSELTLGIVGLGRIGHRVAVLARPLFGRIVAHDPHRGPAGWPNAITRLELRPLLATADVISLHVPLTPGTTDLLGPDELSAVRRGAFLVNVSRGGLVDEAALLAALQRGDLAGVALDVLRDEPPEPGSPLVQHPQVLVTPHVAYLSETSARGYVKTQADNAVHSLATGRPRHPVTVV